MNKFSQISESNYFIDVNRVNLDSELIYITENNKIKFNIKLAVKQN